MAMRFYLQPVMATLLAVHDGLKDAHREKPAYFWALFTDPTRRRDQLRDGWKSVGKIFIIAAALDVIYQLLVLHGLRPVQTFLVAALLALIPYAAFRGPVNRLARIVLIRGRT